MLMDGVIEPSISPWASPVVLVPKPDGSTRMCVDYGKLNQICIQDAHPLPHTQDVLDNMRGGKVFSTMDLKSGFWQMALAKEDQPVSAFVTHHGLWQFKRLPFGHVNAPAQFQRAVNNVLRGLLGKNLLCLY